MDNEALQAMKQLFAEEREHTSRMMDEKLKEALKPIKDDLEELKEDMKEVKGSVASIVDWIDEAEHAVEIRFPIRKKEA